MIIAGKTDKGKVRRTNQDDYAAGKLPGSASYAVVCDGMGGANGGNVASSTAVKIISESILNGFSPSFDNQHVHDLLENSIQKANAEVYEMARKDQSLFGMGTTVVACVAGNGNITVAHAGDSRAYLLNKEFVRLTRDHSMVQEMIENGKITPEEALIHPQKNIITRALGVEENLDIDFSSSKFEEGDSVLICTDGLTNLVSDDLIENVAKETSPGECADKLVDLANENGGSDNITVVVIYNALTGSDIDG